MGIERCPRQTEGISTHRFSCLHKTRISDELPNGSQQELEHFHTDLETAFLQRQSYCVNRDVVCQLPPEAGHPPFIAASLKRAYGMNDAPRRSWNFLDKALCCYGMIPTRADRFCHVLYSTQTCVPNWNKTCSTQVSVTNDISLKSCVRSQGDDALEGSPDAGKRGRILKSFCR